MFNNKLYNQNVRHRAAIYQKGLLYNMAIRSQPTQTHTDDPKLQHNKASSQAKHDARAQQLLLPWTMTMLT
jgi:hypothetical protein